MERKSRIRNKWIMYIALLLFTAIVQSTLLPNVNILGGTPQLLPFAVSAIAMLEGVTGGASAGLAAGIIMDAMSGTEGFYTIVYVLCGIIISLLTLLIYRKTYFVSLLFWLVSVVFVNVLYYVFFVLVMGKGTPAIIFYNMPGELLSTVLFTAALYPAIMATYNRAPVEED